MSLLNEDDDWIEAVRRVLYPRLHPYLRRIGGYSVGSVSEDQHVATIQMGEEEFEAYVLSAPHHFERNPIAAYKTAPDGDKSTLSLRLTSHGSDYYDNEYVEDEKQLHWTFFKAADGAIDLYAHYEYDWQAAPLKHLREVELSEEEGRRRSLRFLEEETGLKEGDDYYTND